MWILIKLGVTAIAFLFGKQLRSLAKGKKESVRVGDLLVHVDVDKSKHGVNATYFSFDTHLKAAFKFTEEGSADRLFKWLNLADEFQTGDPTFDEKIYVAADTADLKSVLASNAKLRADILEFFKISGLSIEGDGERVWFKLSYDRTDEPSLRDRCAEIFKALNHSVPAGVPVLHDIFAFKVLLVESIVWGLSIYGLTSFGQLFLSWSRYLDPKAVVYQGLVLGLFLVVALVGGLAVFLKGSSRGHRVLVELSFLSLVGIFPGGIGMVSDINDHFDRSSERIRGTVTHLHSETRRRKGGTYEVYFVTAAWPNDATNRFNGRVPTVREIDGDMYRQLKVGSGVEVVIGEGKLGHAWIRSLEQGF